MTVEPGGLGFGGAARFGLWLLGPAYAILFTFWEALMGYLPMVWRWTPGRVFGEEVLAALGAHLVYFGLLTLPGPFLPVKWREPVVVTGILLAGALVVVVLGTQAVAVIIAMHVASAVLAAALLHACAQLWRSGGKVRKWGVVTACIALSLVPFGLMAFGSRSPMAASRPAMLPAAGASTPPSLIMVVYDTVNRDGLSAYGYERETSPVFDRVAASGVRFDTAYTTGPWTVPSHASVFTGRFPRLHGAHHEHPSLRDSEVTLAEILEDAGYQTAAFSSNPWISRTTGFGQGFERYDEAWRAYMRNEVWILQRFMATYLFPHRDKGGRRISRSIETWIQGLDRSRPFFLFVNLMESHVPYHMLPDRERRRYLEGQDREMSRSALAKVGGDAVNVQLFGGKAELMDHGASVARSMHDGGVHYTDEMAGRILDAMRTAGLSQDAITMLLTDHGELFGQHGKYGHEETLLEPLIRIGMAFSWPGRTKPGTVIDGTVSTVDILPTLLDWLGIEGPGADDPPIQGTSLLPLLGVGDRRPTPIVAENYVPLHLEVSWFLNHPFEPPVHLDQRSQAIVLGRFKYVRITPTGAGHVAEHLFDLQADPGEEFDESSSQPGQASIMAAALDAWLGEMDSLGAAAPGPAPAIDPETVRHLEQLGYAGTVTP